MKVAATALLFAASVVGTLGLNQGKTWPPNSSQTTRENVCKSTVKDLLQCSIKNDYVAATDSWKSPLLTDTCVKDFSGTLEKCRGAAVAYKNGVAPVLMVDPGHPAFAAAGTVTKMLGMQALVTIPAEDSKLRGVSCSVCTKFTSKLLECALPVAVPAGTDARAKLIEAGAACLSTNWDKVLYNICFKNAFISPLTVATGNKVTYVFASPSLQIDELEENCPSVEAKAKRNGAVFARVGKAHIGENP